MFCREQVAQLRDVQTEIAAHANLAIIGSGSALMARAFAEDAGLDAPLFTDPSCKVFKAAELKRGAGKTINRQSIKNSARALKAGFSQGLTKGQPWQQGGVFVFAPGDRDHYAYASEVAGDHPSTEAILGALQTL